MSLCRQVFKIGGKALGEFLHTGSDTFCDLDGIGTWRLVNPYRCARLSIKAAELVKRLGSSTAPRLSTYRAIGIGAKNVSNSCWLVSRPSVLIVSWNRWSEFQWAAPSADRRLDVSALYGLRDFGGRELEIRKLVGIEPNAHGVIERPKQKASPTPGTRFSTYWR